MRLLLFIFLFITSTLFANIGKVSAIKGDVTAVRDGKNIALSLNTILEEKDLIKTGVDGRLQIVFNDKTIISIGKNSTFDITEYIYDDQKPKESKVLFNVNKGIFKTITGQIGKLNPSKFKLKTKSASIGIRGTIYFVDVQPGEQETYSCTEGSIEVVTASGSVVVPAGYQTKVEFGKPPTVPTQMDQEQTQALEKDSGAQENEAESAQTGEKTAQDNEQENNTEQAENETTTDDNENTGSEITQWGDWNTDDSISTVNSDVYGDTWTKTGTDELVKNISSMGTTGTAKYETTPTGTFTTGGQTYTIDSATSKFELTFDFGQNKLAADIDLKDAGGTANSITLTNDPFGDMSLNNNTGSSYTTTSGNGTISGKFYNGGAKTKGDFDLDIGGAGTTTATGTFEGSQTTSTLQ